MKKLPRVVADGPLTAATLELLDGIVELVPWEVLTQGRDESIEAIYTFGHPKLDGSMMDNVPNIRVISNYGVGVDHIDLADARKRGIPVGNTPGVLDGATADMGLCLMLAAGRRLTEGDRFARSPAFTSYDPGRMLGREIHGAKLGIVGMGRIGYQVARRALGFDMTVRYFNRNRRSHVEQELGVGYASFAQLLDWSDYLMLCVPLTGETLGLIGESELRQLGPTSVLINISRGAVVDTDALTRALREKWIYAAGLDVTEPEPLPREHPLLRLENVVLAPHLGSATAQTRQAMSRLSVENLQAGLAGKPLTYRVV